MEQLFVQREQRQSKAVSEDIMTLEMIAITHQMAVTKETVYPCGICRQFHEFNPNLK